MEATQTYEQILAAMREEYAAATGIDSDEASDIGIRLRVLAQQLHLLGEHLSALRREVFPQTSTGVYLERHAQCRGLARKAACTAQGTLRFSRGQPAAADIPIARGSICATRPDPQLQFATTADGVLKAGETCVDIPAEAVSAGGEGNVAANAVCLPVSAVPGISGVCNPLPFTGGCDAESDDALRERLLAAYRSISNGANCAFYYDLAMRHEGVSSANVIPCARGRGTVDVVICCASTAIQNRIVPELQAELDRSREINVDAMVFGATRQYANIEAAIAVGDGYVYEDVALHCDDAILLYLASLAVGETLYIARLYELLLGVEGVRNVRITLPAKDIAPTAYSAVRPGAVSVTRMAVA